MSCQGNKDTSESSLRFLEGRLTVKCNFFIFHEHSLRCNVRFGVGDIERRWRLEALNMDFDLDSILTLFVSVNRGLSASKL
jgi:hypothetical protein